MPQPSSIPRLAGLAAILAMSAQLASALPSPVEVWADFDPDKGDFKEEIVREETKGGIYYRDSYVSAYVLGEEIRVYCKYAVKAGSVGSPGLLNVHGWMGAPNVDMDYVNDGWAVLAHDYCGKTGTRSHYSKYPPALVRGNMDKAHGIRVKSKLPDGSFITDPKQTDDYVWCAVQRRALSYLLTQKEVDPNRIGAKGYSYGGTIMWNLGMDARVKAIVAYFGIGWLEYYRTRRVWLYDPATPAPPQTPGEKLYLSAIAPQAHAPQVTAASLWLNGTNDHHGGHERGEQTFKQFKPGVPWSFAHQPRGHHDTQDIGHNAKLWLNKHVLGVDVHWPRQAQSTIKLNKAGVPELQLLPADPNRVKTVKAYYALKNPVSYGRAWRDAPLTRRGNTWTAEMPVLNVNDYVFAFANVSYDNRVVRSTPFTAAIPAKLGNAVATDNMSTDLGSGVGAWARVGPVRGKGGINGFRPLNQRGTFNQQFSDPKWRAPEGAKLTFKFYCTQPQDLIIAANNRYERPVKITASDDWQTMTLPAEDFRSRYNQESMASWRTLEKLEIKPDKDADVTKVIFADFSWSAATAQNEQPTKSSRRD